MSIPQLRPLIIQDLKAGFRRYPPLVFGLLAGVICLVAWLAPATPATAQSQEPDLATYTSWVREAFAAAQRTDRLGLDAAAERLTAATSVQLEDGAHVSVDNRWLAEALKTTEPDLVVIAARLGALLDALAQPDSSAPDDARERLERILKAPPFMRPESQSATLPGWLKAFLNWLGRLIDSLLRPIGTAAASSGSAVGWMIAILGGLLVAAVITYLLVGLRRNLVSEAQLAEDDPQARLTAGAALNQASAMAREGDYRTAVRYLYLSALLRLDERKLLRYDRALTNREYLEQIRSNPALREQLTPIVETFDQVWYGHAALDAADFTAYRQQVEALKGDAI